jgi:hypothetical protein
LFSSRLLPVLLVVLPLLVGCGPSLRYELRKERHFEATSACGQGPFVIDVEPLKARLGKSYELFACSPRDLVGRYRVESADGRLWSEGGFSASRLGGVNPQTKEHYRYPIKGPDNARCLAEPALFAPLPEAAVVEEAPWPEPPPPVFVVPAPLPEPMFAARLVERKQRALSCPSSSLYSIGIFMWEHRVGSSKDRSDAHEEPFRIVLYSEEPNDLEDVTFILKQSAAISSDGERAYLAHLREQETKERRRGNEKRRLAQDRRDHCAANHDDVLCWGLGGYEGHKAREKARSRRYQENLAARPSPPPRVAAAPICSRGGVPPPAYDELAPPRPTPRSVWVPGYFTHACSEWVWSSGFWRVPEQDLVQERLLISAPAPPPPPRAEPRPTLVVGVELVWIPGQWMWDGARFVWLDGSYRARPRAGASWRPAEWRRHGGGARYVPGRWE